MEKLENLTKEQEKLLVKIKDKWVNKLYNPIKLNKQKAKKSINWLYDFCNLKKQPDIIFVDNPFHAQVVINMICKISDYILSEFYNNKNNQVWNQVGNQVWNQVENQNFIYYSTTRYGSIWDYGWCAFMDFFECCGIIKHKEFNNFVNLLDSGIFDMILAEDFTIVYGMPNEINVDGQYRLHNINESAIKLRGYELNYIHGRHISDEKFNLAKSGKLTKKQFISEKNEEIRAAWYEILGDEKICELLQAKEIDSQQIKHENGDIETIKLLKTSEVFEEVGERLAWVKYICPSTEQVFLIPCEPKYNNALDAAVSQSIFTKEEYSFNLRA